MLLYCCVAAVFRCSIMRSPADDDDGRKDTSEYKAVKFTVSFVYCSCPHHPSNLNKLNVQTKPNSHVKRDKIVLDFWVMVAWHDDDHLYNIYTSAVCVCGGVWMHGIKK